MAFTVTSVEDYFVWLYYQKKPPVKEVKTVSYAPKPQDNRFFWFLVFLLIIGVIILIAGGRHAIKL